MLRLELAQTGLEFRDLRLQKLRAASALLFVVRALRPSVCLRALTTDRTGAITFLSGCMSARGA